MENRVLCTGINRAAPHYWTCAAKRHRLTASSQRAALCDLDSRFLRQFVDSIEVQDATVAALWKPELKATPPHVNVCVGNSLRSWLQGLLLNVASALCQPQGQQSEQKASAPLLGPMGKEEPNTDNKQRSAVGPKTIKSWIHEFRRRHLP